MALLPPSTTKRRSAAMWIEVTQPEAKKPSPDHDSKKEDLPTLMLTHFATTPCVCFGEVKLNTTKLEALIVHNPTNASQIITVEKLSSDKGFHIEKTRCIIEAGSQEILKIWWTPQKSGNFRELVNFKVNNTYRKHVILLGTAVVPKVSKERKIKPLKVLHPTNQTFIKSASNFDSGALLYNKTDANTDSPIYKRFPVENDCLFGESAVSKVSVEDFHPKCGSGVYDCIPPNLSINSVCRDESYEKLEPNHCLTPEILRAYRNRPKKVASNRRKSQYNVRLTPEGHPSATADNASFSAPPTELTVKVSNERSPTRIPIALGRGSQALSGPTKIKRDARSENPAAASASSAFCGIVDRHFSLPVQCSSQSPTDRRQTYVSRSPTSAALAGSLSPGISEICPINVKNRVAHSVGACSSETSKPMLSTVDRRQTYVARSPRVCKLNPNAFPPAIDKSDTSLFPDIPDTPERRNTFVKQGPSHAILPNVTSPNASWADQCEILESELMKDLTVGCLTNPFVVNCDVPRLEGISKENRIATKHTPPKSRLPRKTESSKSKTAPFSNHGDSASSLSEKSSAHSALSYQKVGSELDEVDDSSENNSLVSDSLSDDAVTNISSNLLSNEKSKMHDSVDRLSRCRPLTYRQNRYSDIIEVDDCSDRNDSVLPDSLEVISPGVEPDKSVSISPHASLPSKTSAFSDSLEGLSSENQTENLPRILICSDSSAVLRPALLNKPALSALPADERLVNRLSGDFIVSDEVACQAVDLMQDVHGPDLDLQSSCKAVFSCKQFNSNKHLHISNLNYDEFCQELPVATSSVSDCREGADEEEIRRCSTEVKPQCPKENFPIEACRELFPEVDSETVFFDPGMYRTETDGDDDGDFDDLRRISSDTYIKTPQVSPLKLLCQDLTSISVNATQCDIVTEVPNEFKVPGKRKSDEFTQELQQSTKRIKGQELPSANSSYQDTSVNKAKPRSVQPQYPRGNKSFTKVMPHRLKLIKPPVTPRTALAHHPNPFAAKNSYYDEKWAEKRTHGFTRWLNFVLAMPDEFVMGEEAIVEHMKSMDVREVTCPSREVLSLREYRAGCSLNRLRRKACSFYQSKQIASVVNRVEAEIEKGQLLVRKDRALHADVGIRQTLLGILLGYNSLWLRIGLETVFGVLIPIRDNNDVDGLSNFIGGYLLNNADLAKEYAHPVVPYLYKPGFAQALKKHTLKKFLLLVYFLDHAKAARLLQYNPCLFQKNAPFKSSKDLLLNFSKDYLHGEGNIVKHLAFIGYKVSVQQSYLDEYDFSVKNLAVDLRNGIRLVKVTELITHNWTLLSQVRIPSESRFQKLHNIGLVFAAFKAKTSQPIKDVVLKDIVDGHKEKTLYVLWQILYHLQISSLLNEKQLRKEIAFLESSIQHRHISSRGDIMDMALFMSTIKELYPEENLQLLLRWCNLVCAHYGMQVENFTVAFSDGRALCFLINHYFPLLLPLESVNLDTTQTYRAKSESSANTSYSSEDSFNSTWTTPALAPDKYESLLQNERNNLNLVLQKVVELGGIPLLLKANTVCNTIPDEKVMISFISYLWSRLWNLAAEVRAARTIQLVWRRRSFNLKKKKRLEVEKRSATIIQTTFRRHLLKKQHHSASVIQKAWRTYQRRLPLHNAASKVQAWFRGLLYKQQFNELKEKIILLQSVIRGFLVRSKIRKTQLEKQVKAATLVQACVRGFLCRKHYRILLTSIVALQAACKGHLLRSFLKKELLARKKVVASAIVIQTAYRGFAARKRYLKMLKIILNIQCIGKGILVRRKVKLQMIKQKEDIVEHNRAATTIQRYFRLYCKLRNERNAAATMIQAVYRGYVQRQSYSSLRSAILAIQQWYRGCHETRKMRFKYLLWKQAIIRIQTCVRQWSTRKRYQAMRIAAVKIQSHYKGLRERRKRARAQSAAIKIQSWFRSCYQRQKFCQTRCAVVKIQCWYRLGRLGHKDRDLYLAYKAAAIKLQAWVRLLVALKQYNKMKSSAICIQAAYRGYVQKKKYNSVIQAAVRIQAVTRAYFQKKRYLQLCQATVIIQQQYRNMQVTRLMREEFLHKRKNAIILQSLIRMWLLRKNFNEKKSAVIMIQSAIRSHLQRKHYNEVKKSVLKIQQWYRRCKHGQSQRLLFLKSRLSVVRIQRFFRMHLMRQKYKLMNGSAVKIQTTFRTYKQQQRYQQFKRNVVKIQSLHRGRTERRSYIKQRYAALQIQRWYRTKLLGKQVRELFLQQRKAVIAIQALVRKWLAVQKYLKLKVAAIKIQSTVRGFLSRNRYRTMCSATLKIQAYLKAHWQRRNFLDMRSSAVEIQRWYRSLKNTKQQRSLFLRQRIATIKIQAWFRMCLRKKYFLKVQASTLKLQSCYRGYQQRKHYTVFRHDIIKLQRWYRNCLITKQQRRFFLRQKAAIVLIQNWYWSILEAKREKQLLMQRLDATLTVQKWYRKNWKAKRQRHLFLLQRHAACTLQQYYRYHIRAKLQRQHFLLQKHAAITIQSWYRSSIVGRFHQMSFKRQRNAAVCIQMWYRSSILSKRQRKLFLQQRNAAMLIQLRYRHSVIGKNERRMFLRLKVAVVTIQLWYKGYLKGREQRKLFVQKQNAAIVIQNYYKSSVARKTQQKLFLLQRNSVITIQRWYRNCISRRLQRKLFSQQKSAARVIQQWYRRCMLCNSQRNLFLTQRNAAVLIQRWYKSCSSAQSQRKLFLMQKSSAIIIQQWRRNCNSGRLQRKLFSQQKSAARVIQQWYRSCTLGNSQRNLFLTQRNAAVLIQRWYKSCSSAQSQRKLFLLQKSSAIIIQQWRRNCNSGRLQRKLFSQQKSAARVIQQWCRRCMLSNSQRKLFLTKRNAAVLIQRWYKSCSSAQSQRQLFLLKRSSVIVIQRWYRSYIVSRSLRELFLCQRTAVLAIQHWFRNCVFRRVERKSFLQQRNSVRIIQQWYRNCVQVRSQQKLFLLKKNASITIQLWYRACMLSRMERTSFLKIREATGTIQRWYRNHIFARNENLIAVRRSNAAIVIHQWYKNILIRREQIFLKQNRAACTVQHWFKASCVARHQRQSFLAVKKAAITIQSWYRRCRIAKHQQQFFQQSRNAALILQRWYRSCTYTKRQRLLFVVHKKSALTIQQWYKNCMVATCQRRSFLQSRSAAITIQMWYRSCVEAKHQRLSFLHYKDAALAIQRWYRSCTLTKRQQHLFLQYKKAALTIQHWYRRCTLARQQQLQFTEDKRDIIIVQSCVRRWLVVKKFKQRNKAAVVIQSWFRSCRQRKTFTAIKNATVKLQAVIRMRHQRQLFLEARLATILIQRWYRHCQHTTWLKKELMCQQLAARIIQTYVRLWIVKKKTSLNEAAVVLQRKFKQHLERKHFLQKRKAVVTIQASFRAWQDKKQFARLQAAAVIIQSNYRSTVQRKKYRKLLDSTIKMQALYRASTTRRTFLHMRLAAVVIQRWFRCRRIREMLYLDYQWKCVAAVKIQALFRGWRVRQQVHRMNIAAKVIQAHIRGWITRRQMYWMDIAARVIQTAYRQYHLHKCQEQFCCNYAATIIQTTYRGYRQRVTYLRMKCATVTVQCWFRKCKQIKAEKNVAAVKLQSFVRMCITKKKYRRKLHSVLIIQNAYRAHLQRLSFLKMKMAAITCQSMHRGHVQHMSYIQTINAVKVIQNWYRVCRMQQIKRQYFTKCAAAVLIQSWARMWLCQKRYKEAKHSAIIIQNAYNTYVQRQSYIKQKLAAVTIQRWIRLLRKGRAAREKFLSIRLQIISVQSYIRQWLVSRKYKKMCRSACLIQATIRAYLCRKSYLKFQYAARMIQQWFRSTCEMQKARRNFRQSRNAAVTIQSCYKSYVQRRAFLAFRCSAIIIQSYFRMWSCRRDFQALKDVVILLQRWYRNTKARSVSQQAAAVKIQSWYRMCSSKRHYLAVGCVKAIESPLLRDREGVCQLFCTTDVVQKCTNIHHLGKKRKKAHWETNLYGGIQDEWHALQCYIRRAAIERAAITIQHWYRNLKRGSKVRRWFLITRGAILTIQAFYRGMKCRQNFLLYQRASVQPAYHLWLMHQQGTVLQQAAVVIQQWWRSVKLGFNLQYDYLVMRGAAIILQAWIRCTLTRRNYLIMRGASICIQANWRGHQARVEYGVYRGAVLFIQCEFRRKLLFRRDLVRYHVMRGAAITIQAFARGYLVRKQCRMGKSSLEYIQEQFNADFKALFPTPSSHFADLSFDQQASFHVMRGAAITIQAWVRGWLLRKHMKFIAENRCSLYFHLAYGHFRHLRLSSAGDKYLSRSPYPVSSIGQIPCTMDMHNRIGKNMEYQQIHDHVVKIQSFVRMRLARQRYVVLRAAALLLQTWYRRILLKRRQEEIIQRHCHSVAARKIQHCWRKHQKLKLTYYLLACQQNVAAMTIQACWRERQKRLLAEKRCWAALKIQKGWLVLKAKRLNKELLDRKNRAASIIQESVRNFVGQRVFLKRQTAAIKIQSWFRMLLARRDKELAMQNDRRASYLEKFASSVHFHLSVIRIQRAYRIYSTRNQERSALRIQAVWRGHKVRSEVRDRRISSVRQRILDATQSATPDNTLWNRTITALDYLLHCRNLSTVLVAINDLDVAVRLSSKCCRQLVNVGGVPVLYKLLSGCNRSIPHMELISGTISILLSLAKYEETTCAVWQDEKAMDIIPDIMRNFREKNPQILTKCCSLLWLLAQDQHYCLIIRQNNKFVELLQSIHYLACRKARKEEQRFWQLASLKGQILPVCKGSPSKMHHKTCRIQPDWILGRGHMREFEDPISALSALLKSLNIAPKGN